jgi:hypothetical protein
VRRVAADIQRRYFSTARIGEENHRLASTDELVILLEIFGELTGEPTGYHWFAAEAKTTWDVHARRKCAWHKRRG